ncbi:3TM-type holin [Azospirillum endophyticum]
MAVAIPLITALTPLLADLLDKIPDPDAKAKAAASANAQLVALLQSGDAAQLQVNVAEAGNPSLFVSGWRPAVGWVCVLGLLVQTVGYPLLGWGLSLWYPGTPMPSIDTDTLMSLLVPMLGLGAYRTFEKVKGVAR